MDLLKLVKSKSEAFSDTNSYLGLQSVMSHIGIAERHLKNGKNGDDYFFTDVIYRTNQAFEGALKEAYAVLSGKDPEKKSPYQIEEYLERKDLLEERVLSLFSNYRVNWRNKSTHDYKLYFSEQEAFLAIVNIYAFFNILLDQMLEKLAYESEKEKLGNVSKIISDEYLKNSFIDQVVELLTKFAIELPPKTFSEAPHLYERELIGMLAAFLNVADPHLDVVTEFALPMGSGRVGRIDMRISRDNQIVVVELKLPSVNISLRRKQGVEQLFAYMAASNVDKGILFIPPSSAQQEMRVERMTTMGSSTIIEIYPKSID